MPAAGPIPEEVAKCFEGKPGQYGRDLVSTGPYMIEGADDVDASSCAALKPMSGFDGQTQARRSSATRTTTRRPTRRRRARACPTAFEFTVNANPTTSSSRVAAGELEDETPASIPPQMLRRYAHATRLQEVPAPELRRPHLAT